MNEIRWDHRDESTGGMTIIALLYELVLLA